MTIQTINIGTVPNDDTGDDPRTVGQKLSSNFTTSTHAASRDVGTASGNIPDADDLNMVGNTNYTSGNLNPNVFGGQAGTDLIAEGYAENATAAVFDLPISLPSPPSSFTQSGTFTVKKAAGFATVAAGLTINSLAGTTSNKYAVLVINSGLAAMTAGEKLLLISDSGASKITVNP